MGQKFSQSSLRKITSCGVEIKTNLKSSLIFWTATKRCSEQNHAPAYHPHIPDLRLFHISNHASPSLNSPHKLFTSTQSHIPLSNRKKKIKLPSVKSVRKTAYKPPNPTPVPLMPSGHLRRMYITIYHCFYPPVLTKDCVYM